MWLVKCWSRTKNHDEDMVQKLWLKYTNLGGYNGTKKFVEIELSGSFENASQCYEDWCAVWVIKLHAITKPHDWKGRWAELEKPIVGVNKCIHCAIEEALKKAAVEEYKRDQNLEAVE